MKPSEQSPNPATKERVIRVFISSTFRDMQQERDYLVKFIFPQLRKLCESRGVTWGEVDLRWGVTDEQAAEGKVLPICLEEIKRCRPYFIGLLGERYGWIPDALPADLLEREPWLKEHLHGKTSVTELEILHGVLLNPQMAGQAYFYFRDPAFVNSIPEKDWKDFVAENADDAEKLRVLKENIRRSGFPVRENYPDPKALGELVLADLAKVINDLFPEGSQPDPLDREAMDHEAYAQSRERVYIGRQEYFDRLDSHAAANGTQPLVILGDSGSGKSALLANWVARYRQAHPDALMLQHYIGATPYSADWAAMLRRLMGEFKRRLGLQQDIPDQPDALRSAFPNWLYMAAAKGSVVLVLDALNQLEDRDGAPDLVWLPPVLPENVRLIVSTLPGRPLVEIQNRHWPTLNVALLSTDERRKLIADYLAQHAKSLNAARVERIAAAPPSANPLYLRVLLDELRLVRTHEELEERIGDYLKAESPCALYEKVIARWEQDYEGDTDLVGDTLSLLWAARRGLTETELLDALGKPNSQGEHQPLPCARWSPLFLAMSDALISRGGLLTFAHDFLRAAVVNTYLAAEQNQQQANLRLADYFQRQDLGQRMIDELPFQLARAQSWQRLYDLLGILPFFLAFWRTDSRELRRCWALIERESSFRAIDAYQVVINFPFEHRHTAWYMAAFMADAGYVNEAVALREFLVDQFRQTGDHANLASACGNLAVLQKNSGNLDKALALCEEQERLCREMGDKDGLQRALGNQANIFALRGDLGRARTIHEEEESLCRELGDKAGLAHSLGNQATILFTSGNLAESMRLRDEEERLWRELGNEDGLQNSFGCRGTILYTCSQFDAALEMYTKQESICRGLGNKEGLQRALSGEGLILYARRELQGAAAKFREEEELCRKLGNTDGLQRTLGNQALLLKDRGDMDGALALFRQQEKICRESCNLYGLVFALGNQANFLFKEMDRAKEALPLAEEACRLATEHGYATLAKRCARTLNAIRQASPEE